MENNINQQPVTVVLVGIGGYGALYVDELLADMDNSLCRLVGVVDPAAAKSPKFDCICERGIPVYATLEAFYNHNQAELCCIAAPIQFHTPYTVYAMEHGSHVICEKPLSGCYTDGVALAALSDKTGKFIISGYQWSHNRAILSLKRDILDGKFGAVKQMRTKILWPRRESYFKRGSGWAGKRCAADGTYILDSVANNAAAHYLHNMLFLLGDRMNSAALPVSVDAELMRVNPIENFDTCAIRMHTADGAPLLFLATHATKENEDPVFIYEFEKGSVSFAAAGGHGIVAVMNDGEEISYGNPFDDQMVKVRYALRAVRDADARAELPCIVSTAVPHAQCIWAIRDVPIADTPEALLEEIPGGENGEDILRVIRPLHDAMNLAYDKCCMLSELNDAVSADLRKVLKPVMGLSVGERVGE